MIEQVQKALEKVIELYTSGDYYREVYEAKQSYFENLGNASEDSQDFENQMDLFMSWYLFNRPLSKHALPPIFLFCRNELGAMEKSDRDVYTSLSEARHSIFEVIKIRDTKLTVRDLSNDEKCEVEEVQFRFGFSKGDLFEGRLIPQGKKFVFINGFCFHPKEVQKYIEQQMKKIRSGDAAQRSKIILHLSYMSKKHQRFPHISAEHIYSQTPVF